MCFSSLQGCPCTRSENAQSKSATSTSSKRRHPVETQSDEFDQYGYQTESYNSRKWVTKPADTRSQAQLERIAAENNCKGCSCMDSVLQGISVKAANSDEFVRMMRQVPRVDGCCCVRKALDAFEMWSDERHERRAQRVVNEPAEQRVKIKPSVVPSTGEQIAVSNPNADDDIDQLQKTEAKQAQAWRYKYLGNSLEKIADVPQSGLGIQNFLPSLFSSVPSTKNSEPAADRSANVTMSTNTDNDDEMKMSETKKAEKWRKTHIPSIDMGTNTSIPKIQPIIKKTQDKMKPLTQIRQCPTDCNDRQIMRAEIKTIVPNLHDRPIDANPKLSHACNNRQCVICNKPLEPKKRKTNCRICNTPLKIMNLFVNHELNKSRERYSIQPMPIPINKSKENHCIISCPKQDAIMNTSDSLLEKCEPCATANDKQIQTIIQQMPTNFTAFVPPESKTKPGEETCTIKNVNYCILSALVKHDSKSKLPATSNTQLNQKATPIIPTKKSVATGTRSDKKVPIEEDSAHLDEKKCVRKWFNEHMPSDSSANSRPMEAHSVRKPKAQLKAIMEQSTTKPETEEETTAAGLSEGHYTRSWFKRHMPSPSDEKCGLPENSKTTTIADNSAQRKSTDSTAKSIDEDELRLKTEQYKAMAKETGESDDNMLVRSEMHYTKSWFRKNLPVSNENVAELPPNTVPSHSNVNESENILQTCDLQPTIARNPSTEGTNARSDDFYTKTWFKNHLPSSNDSSLQNN